MFYVQNVSIYMNLGGTYMVHRTFFVYFIKKKTEKGQEHDLYLNQILHHFDFFPRMNNKNIRKAPMGLHSYFFTK